MEQKIAMVDQLARGYAARGRKIEFSNSAVAGMVYDVNASPQQKAALLNKAFGAHSHSRHSKFDSWIIISLQWVRRDLERVLRVQRFYLQQLMVVH